MTNSRTRRGRRGFTLMEMLVVWASSPCSWRWRFPKSWARKRRQHLGHRIATEALPQLPATLRSRHEGASFHGAGPRRPRQETLRFERGQGQTLDGPYTESGELPKDPWGNDFQYEYPPKHGTGDFPDIWSKGPDGEDGNEDDIVSWSHELSENKGSAGRPAAEKPAKSRSK